MGGILPNILFMKRFYYTSINKLWDIHTLKHVQYFFKVIDSQSKPFTYTCLLQLLGMLLRKFSFNSCTPIISNSVSLGNKYNYSLRSIKRAVYLPTLNRVASSFCGASHTFSSAINSQGRSMNLTLK